MGMNYVIMDMEWIDCPGKIACPTQIAAMRVDAKWKRADLFSSLIRPDDPSCHDWNHIAYRGAEREAFLAAEETMVVFQSLQDWLKPDDVLLWWAEDPAKTFASVSGKLLGRWMEHPVYLLQGAVVERFGKRINAYKLAKQHGIKVPGHDHVSVNDVEVIRAVMAAFPNIKPRKYNPCFQKKGKTQKRSNWYHYDPIRKMLHRADSDCERNRISVQGYGSLEGCIRKRMNPCPVCCEPEYKAKAAELTRNRILAAHYNYVYRPHSEVFHRTDCTHARRMSYWEIRGSQNYKTCIQAGKRPCRVCKPEEIPVSGVKTQTNALGRKWEKKADLLQPAGMTRPLNPAEQRAWKRYLQSLEERTAEGYSASDRDAVIRTSASCAFWSAKEYKTFHINGCRKLAGLSGIRGYSRYQDAVKRGFVPCKQCRPTSKHDLPVTMYRDSRIREGENTEMLDALCDANGYRHQLCGPYYCISTPVGKWRIHETQRPVELWHVNLVNCRGSSEEYHRQPKLILSLQDTFHYIHDHDRALMKGREVFQSNLAGIDS